MVISKEINLDCNKECPINLPDPKVHLNHALIITVQQQGALILLIQLVGQLRPTNVQQAAPSPIIQVHSLAQLARLATDLPVGLVESDP